MPEMQKKSFWATIPGVVTGIAAILTSVGALVPLLIHLADHTSPAPVAGATPAPSSPASPAASPSGGPSPLPGTMDSGDPFPTGTAGATPSAAGAIPTTTGSGVANLTVAPASVDLGQASLGNSSAVSTVSVTNAGSGQATIDSVIISGAQAGQFNVASSTCGIGMALAPAQSCQIGIRFQASTTGSASASLVIGFDPPSGSQLTVPLSGTGTLL